MTLLLLAGTGEAKALSKELASRGVSAIASLAGATRSPDRLPIPTRTGGFGGGDRFLEYVDAAGITAVLDATHPFARAITERTAKLCKARDLPHAILQRPEWVAEDGDRWTAIASEEQAAAHIPTGDTVFLATGRQTLGQFANLADRRIYCRQIDPPDAPFPFNYGDYIVGRPPFSVEKEIALFQRLGVDWLVVKNAGGAMSRSKLDAARRLGIPVLMLQRPPLPEAKVLRSVAKALAWIEML